MSETMIVKSVEVLAAEINTIKGQIRATVLSGAIEIGQRLTEVKALIPHGQWGAWLEENVDYSERTAQNLMRVSDEYSKNTNPQALADLSYTKAVALLGLPKDLRDELMEEQDVDAMSTRELQDEIQRIRAENEAKQIKIAELEESAQSRVDKGQQGIDTEAAEALEKARTDAETAKAEAKRLADELAAAKKDAAKREAAEKSLEKAKEKEKAATAKVAELEEQLKKAAEEVKTVNVEVVPESVTIELEELRAIAAKAPTEEVVRLRAGFERFAEEFKTVFRLLGEVEQVSPEDAEKYRAAIDKALIHMQREINGGDTGG